MNALERLVRALQAAGYGKRLAFNEPMAAHTSFQIGGPADLLMTAETIEEIITWVRMAHEEGVPCLVLGSGTNILVADEGIRGLVILNACRRFSLDDQGRLTAESGALFKQVAQWAVEQGWEGIEWAVGIPGTIGGAVIGNAGAYGGYIADVLQKVRLLKTDGCIEWVNKEALSFGYRTSALKQSPCKERPIVLEAILQLRPGSVDALRTRAREVTEQRFQRTPEGASAGSMFKRTSDYAAGFLIEQAGLKGLTIGGAQISPKHANFFINVGGASANDVVALIKIAQERVWERFGQWLEPEIEFVGEWPDHKIPTLVHQGDSQR